MEKDEKRWREEQLFSFLFFSFFQASFLDPEDHLQLRKALCLFACTNIAVQQFFAIEKSGPPRQFRTSFCEYMERMWCQGFSLFLLFDCCLLFYLHFFLVYFIPFLSLFHSFIVLYKIYWMGVPLFNHLSRKE